jgi:ribonuclease Z
MDHFIGFDQVLRVCLGRDRHIRLFGPPGIVRCIENRIGSYTWNLVESYTNDFALFVTEVEAGGGRLTRCYRCRTAFQPEAVEAPAARPALLADETFFSVRGVFLDHRIPSLAFRFEEKRRINIKKTALAEMGLCPGPWLMNLKELILAGAAADTPVSAVWKGTDGVLCGRQVTLGELKDRVVRITPGRSMAYVTDAVFSQENAGRIVEIAVGAEILFIEATFLDTDRQRAAQKFHLTARQAGMLAHRAGVKRIQPFHFSPKYRGREEGLVNEALEAFAGDGREGP